MKNNQNYKETWDIIWGKSNELDLDAIKIELERTKKTGIWKNYTEIIKLKFGGWDKITSIELGSGMGWHSTVAASEGATVCLLDYSEQAIELAKKRFELLGISANFIHGDAFDIEKNKKTNYNLAWSFGTVEHFRGDLRQKFFDLHFNYIEKKGLVIISSPYKYAINYRIWMHYAELYKNWEFGLEIPYSKTEFLSRLKIDRNKPVKIIYDEGRPCLKKALNILKVNSRIKYLTIGTILKFFIKFKLKIPPFYFRSIILVAEKR